jgi:hypothetical protein
VCGLCGAKLVARPRGDKRRCYVCATGPNFHGCGKIRSLSEPLEALVVEAVIARLDGPPLAAAVKAASWTVGDADAALGRLAQIAARVIELGEMWAAEEVTREFVAAATRQLEEERAKLAATVQVDRGTRALAALGDTVDLASRWPTLGFDRQRGIVEAVVENVTIGPAVKGRNFFDPSRVDVIWKA